MKQFNNTASLREYWTRMSTEQMDALLQDELGREVPDGEKVRLMLGILEAREAPRPEDVEAGVNAAWKKYESETTPRRKRTSAGRTAAKVAAIAAVIALVISVLPQDASAESFWQRLARWTDSIFELFTPGGASIDQVEYEFVTDNPGLQQVYDAVVELGVTEPVVPMWLPEGYVLTEMNQHNSPTKDMLTVMFVNEESNVIFEVSINKEGTPSIYHKDKTAYREVEIAGTSHSIMRNNDLWTVVWVNDGLDCMLTLDCHEEELNRILLSIYGMED